MLVLPSCRKENDAAPVISAVSAFASEENFSIKYTVGNSFVQDGEEYNFEKQYTKYACDTLSGERYYEQSGVIYLDGEKVGEPYASFYPPLTVLTINNSFTAGKEYDDYIVSSDRIFWRTDIIIPTEEDIKKADVSEADGALCYTVKSPCEESVKAICDYIGSDLDNISFSYTVKDENLVGYTQEYTVRDESKMKVTVSAAIETTGDDTEVYNDMEDSVQESTSETDSQ